MKPPMCARFEGVSWAEAEVATEDDSSTVEPSTANIVVTNRYFFIYPLYIIIGSIFAIS